MEFEGDTYPVEVAPIESWNSHPRFNCPTYEAGPHPGILSHILKADGGSFGTKFVRGFMLISGIGRGHPNAPHEALDPREVALARKDEAVWFFFLERTRHADRGFLSTITVKVDCRMDGMRIIFE